MKKTLLLRAVVLFVMLAVTVLILNNLFFNRAQSTPLGGSTRSFEAFLKIDGISGESQDPKHKGEIYITSFSWGETQGVAEARSGTRGSPVMEDFVFVMNYSKASPKLFRGAATGEHFKSAVLTVRRTSDQKEFLKWTFTDISITSYKTSGNTLEDSWPIDKITINFSKIQVEYQQYDSSGNPVGKPIIESWDLKRGTRG